jgi:hypothetical protein
VRLAPHGLRALMIAAGSRFDNQKAGLFET